MNLPSRWQNDECRGPLAHGGPLFAALVLQARTGQGRRLATASPGRPRTQRGMSTSVAGKRAVCRFRPCRRGGVRSGERVAGSGVPARTGRRPCSARARARLVTGTGATGPLAGAARVRSVHVEGADIGGGALAGPGFPVVVLAAAVLAAERVRGVLVGRPPRSSYSACGSCGSTRELMRAGENVPTRFCRQGCRMADRLCALLCQSRRRRLLAVVGQGQARTVRQNRRRSRRR